MITIPASVRAAIEKDGFLHFGLANGLLNLTKTAQFLRPLIVSRTKKNVSDSAILMALSRIAREKKKVKTRMLPVKVDNIHVTKNLVELTFYKTLPGERQINAAILSVRASGGYVVSTFGTSEITILVATEYARQLRQKISEKPKIEIPNLVALSVQFDEKYMPQVGMVYALIQQLTLQNINIMEFTSTYTELIFFLHAKDLKLAFDTLYDQFL